MRTEGEPASFWWRDHGRDHARDANWKPIGNSSQFERPDKLDGVPLCVAGEPPAWAEDLRTVARAAYLADRLTPRRDTFDGWTRAIRLSVPVSEPDRWQPVIARLQLLLEVLTGDHWQLQVRAGAGRAWQLRLPLPSAHEATEVALFSGGLDSLSWAARRAASSATAGPLSLVTYTESGLKRVQARLLREIGQLARASGGRKILPMVASVSPNGTAGRVKERSTRTRGLLYTTEAIRVAAADGVATVSIPENGQLAVNPPLSAGRAAALSTRSVHPWTLHLLNSVIADVAGTVTVVNPLQTMTKGEVCQAALKAGLAQGVLESTVSCNAPPTRRKPSGALNCGTCFPCLVRRSGLLAGAGDDATPYERPLTTGTSSSSRRIDHWTPLRRWLATPFSTTELLGDLPFPPGEQIGAVVEVLQRGRAELNALVAVWS